MVNLAALALSASLQTSSWINPGISVDASQRVWGVLVDTGFPEGTATLVSLADGSASLYLSHGGGLIGGHAHERVRRAARSLVTLGGEHLDGLARTESFPLPESGRVRFYLLTTGGVYTAEENEETLGEGSHRLSPLFHAAHEVIGQLRMHSGQP